MNINQRIDRPGRSSKDPPEVGKEGERRCREARRPTISPGAPSDDARRNRIIAAMAVAIIAASCVMILAEGSEEVQGGGGGVTVGFYCKIYTTQVKINDNDWKTPVSPNGYIGQVNTDAGTEIRIQLKGHPSLQWQALASGNPDYIDFEFVEYDEIEEISHYSFRANTGWDSGNVSITGYAAKDQNEDVPQKTTGMVAQSQDKDEGRIYGLTKDLEFSETGEAGSWTRCQEEDKIVEPGKYYLRARETLAKLASEPVAVYVGPTAPTGPTYDYDGNEKTCTIDGIKSSWATSGGILKATNANATGGTYAATLTLTDYCPYWSDGTQAPKTVEWSIEKVTLTKDDFVIEDRVYTYAAKPYNAKAKLIGYPDGDIEQVAAATTVYHSDSLTQTNAGEYGTKLVIAETSNFKATTITVDDDQEWKLEIGKADLIAEGETSGEWQYDAQEKTLTIYVKKPTWTDMSQDTAAINLACTENLSNVQFESVTDLDATKIAGWIAKKADICKPAVVKWSASAGDNYNTYYSDEHGTNLTFTITKYMETPTAEPLTVEYDGEPHIFDIHYTLYGDDTATVYWGTNGDDVNGTRESVQQTYCNGEKTIYYRIEAGDNYNFRGIHSCTVEITPRQIEADVKVAGQEVDPDSTVQLIYDGSPKELSVRPTNIVDGDGCKPVAYTLNGDPVSFEELTRTLGEIGEYEVGVTVSANGDHAICYTDFTETYTIRVGKTPVEIAGFEYDPVDQGQQMTMRIAFRTVGVPTEAPVISYKGQQLPLASCSYSDLGDGIYVAAAVYDTSLGIIPCGTLETISIQYPGDVSHEESGIAEENVRIRTDDVIVIPDEGGDIPIDPSTRVIVIHTSAGDVELEITDDVGPNDSLLVYLRMWKAGGSDLIPDVDDTTLLDTYGYRVTPEGDRYPLTYRVTPSVDVAVPSGKKPSIGLYDSDNVRTEKPKVLSYTSESATFSKTVGGSLYTKIGISFVKTFVPMEPIGNDVIEVVTDQKTTWLGENGGTVLLIAVIATIIAGLVALAYSRRD